MSSSELNKSRRSMLILLAVFIIPIVLAKLALKSTVVQLWCYQSRATNRERINFSQTWFKR